MTNRIQGKLSPLDHVGRTSDVPSVSGIVGVIAESSIAQCFICASTGCVHDLSKEVGGLEGESLLALVDCW